MPRLPYRARALAALLALAPMSALAAGQTASGQDDFEAALRTVRPPASTSGAPTAAAAPTSNPRSGRSARSQRLIAPAGAVPARFRAMTHYGTDTEPAIRQAAREGQLDAFAMMEQLAGPLPIPPGARPLRCTTDHNNLHYTLGVEASAEYLRYRSAALQEQAGPPGPRVRIVNGETVPSATLEYMGRRSQLAASPTTLAAKRSAQAFLVSVGFVRSSGDTVGRDLYRPGPNWRGRTPISIVFNDDATGIGTNCEERGISVPWGPVIILSYDMP